MLALKLGYIILTWTVNGWKEYTVVNHTLPYPTNKVSLENTSKVYHEMLSSIFKVILITDKHIFKKKIPWKNEGDDHSTVLGAIE